MRRPIEDDCKADLSIEEENLSIEDEDYDEKRAILDEKQERARILEPLIEALTEMRDEYAVRQPCRPPADVVDLALDLVREGLEVPDDF